MLHTALFLLTGTQAYRAFELCGELQQSIAPPPANISSALARTLVLVVSGGEMHQRRVRPLACTWARRLPRWAVVSDECVEGLASVRTKSPAEWWAEATGLEDAPPPSLRGRGYGAAQTRWAVGLQYAALVADAPAGLKHRANRVLAGKVVLAARIDAHNQDVSGASGRDMRADIAKKIEKWQEPPPPKAQKGQQEQAREPLPQGRGVDRRMEGLHAQRAPGRRLEAITEGGDRPEPGSRCRPRRDRARSFETSSLHPAECNRCESPAR